MKPTAYLRWDKREIWRDGDMMIYTPIIERVLQQWWEIAGSEADITIAKEDGPTGKGRWRDV